MIFSVNYVPIFLLKDFFVYETIEDLDVTNSDNDIPIILTKQANLKEFVIFNTRVGDLVTVDTQLKIQIPIEIVARNEAPHFYKYIYRSPITSLKAIKGIFRKDFDFVINIQESLLSSDPYIQKALPYILEIERLGRIMYELEDKNFMSYYLSDESEGNKIRTSLSIQYQTKLELLVKEAFDTFYPN